MYGSWVLLVLILISSLPVIALYIWFRVTKYQISIVWFLFALLAGAAAFFPASILQILLAFPVFAQARAALFYEFFVRIAFTEELSRLLMMFIFFWICKLVSKEDLKNKDDLTTDELSESQSLSSSIIKKGTAAGLIAGFGFAILENARIAASSIDISIILLRIFTAALHGACGARIGTAAVMFSVDPVRALFRVVAATAIHGVYNLMVGRPGLPLIAAFLIAICALLTSILSLRSTPNKVQGL